MKQDIKIVGMYVIICFLIAMFAIVFSAYKDTVDFELYKQQAIYDGFSIQQLNSEVLTFTYKLSYTGLIQKALQWNTTMLYEDDQSLMLIKPISNDPDVYVGYYFKP